MYIHFVYNIKGLHVHIYMHVYHNYALQAVKT
jgi:hypothetical protein